LDEPVANPSTFFHALGGLHDAYIESLAIDVDQRILTLTIDDLNKSFEETPEYPGRRRCLLQFAGLEECTLSVALAEGVRIGQLSVTGETRKHRLQVSLSLGGMPGKPDTWWMLAKFDTVQLVDITS
jgi:hypothetical protein